MAQDSKNLRSEGLVDHRVETGIYSVDHELKERKYFG